MAESKGFLRGCRLSRLALLVATVGKNSPPDCFLPIAFGFLPPCSNPFFMKRKITTTKGSDFIFGGEQGIRTLEQVIARYTISNRAPSASSDNSPNVLLDVLYIIKIKIASKNILCYNIFIKNIGGTL